MGEDPVVDKEQAMWSNISDVFVLTYRAHRADAIFCPDLVMRPGDKGAFSRGRNALLLAARIEEHRRGWAYHYYVFSDVDVAAVGGWSATLPGFVAFLQAWQPAIGVPLYWNEEDPFMYTHLFNSEEGMNPQRPRSIYWHDQMFVAMHHEAARLLFPLDPLLDRNDAMISQWHMSSKASVMYRGHVLLYMRMELRNPKHERDADDTINEMCANVSATLRAKLPPRLQHCVLDIWQGYGVTLFSPSTFGVRHIRGNMGNKGWDAALPGEDGVVYVHSYYPWGMAVPKHWDYSTATLATSPTCDDEPERRTFRWGKPCHRHDRDLFSWLACARHNFLGAA